MAHSGNNGTVAQEVSSIKKPNFFIVGAPKCGTSALHEYLRTHPNIFMPDQKELYYFSNDCQKMPSAITSFDKYLELFQKATHKQLVVGEATPAYLYSPMAINNIYKFNNNAKIIVMLRNPVEMVYSFHSQLLFGCYEDEPDFEKAWKLQESRRNGDNIPKHCHVPSWLQYAQIAKYGEQVERLFTVFPREQVKIILFDDFKKSTQAVYEDVLAFLEVPSDGKTEFPVVNPNTALRCYWFEFVLRYSNRLIILKKMFGIEKDLIIPKFLPKIKALNTKKEHRKPLSSSFQCELINEFKEDIEKLSLLLNKDLSHWLNEK